MSESLPKNVKVRPCGSDGGNQRGDNTGEAPYSDFVRAKTERQHSLGHMAAMREVTLCPRGQPGGASWPLEPQEPKGKSWVASFVSFKRITGKKSPRIVGRGVSPNPSKCPIREGIIFRHTASSETVLPFHDSSHQIRSFWVSFSFFSSDPHPEGDQSPCLASWE